MSFFGLSFGQNADIDIILDNQDERKMAEIRDENGRKERHYLFFDGESVTGKVNVTLHRKTNRLEHQGIKIQFIGQIELYYDRGNHHEFLSLVKELARPGEILQNTSFDFEFNQVEKPYECYTGANVRLRYFLRVTVARRITDMTKEMDLLVHTMSAYPEMNNPIKMEVGIEECLHIEFEYNKSKYHLKDVIVGKIYFLLVRIKIKHMEVAIIKRETTGSGPNILVDSETIAKYEIMDGAPVKGESIPIRVFLAGYDLTPTMKDINKKFSVKYYLNLVLVDEEERRYFKQQEITLWRKSDRPRKMVMYPGGQMVPGGVYGGGMVPAHQQPYVHQVPHAMARHNPGEFPSQNVRTAPTPSGPDDLMSPGGAAVNDAAFQQPPFPGPASQRLPAGHAASLHHPNEQESQEEIIEEEEEEEEEVSESSEYIGAAADSHPAAVAVTADNHSAAGMTAAAKTNGQTAAAGESTAPSSNQQQLSVHSETATTTTDIPTNNEQHAASETEAVAANDVIAEDTPSATSVLPPSQPNHVTEEPAVAAAGAQPLAAEEVLSSAVEAADEPVLPAAAPADQPVSSSSAVDQLVSSAKQLSVTPEQKLHVSDDDDDRPQPPDDMGVAEEEEDDSNNDMMDKSSESDDLFSPSTVTPSAAVKAKDNSELVGNDDL